MRFQLAQLSRQDAACVPGTSHFHYDDSVDKGERIEQLLREAQKPSE